MSSKYGGTANANQRRFVQPSGFSAPISQAPSESWWIAAQTREDFAERIEQERRRMANSKFGGLARTHNIGEGER